MLFERRLRMRSGSDNWKARACVVRELLEHHVDAAPDVGGAGPATGAPPRSAGARPRARATAARPVVSGPSRA